MNEITLYQGLEQFTALLELEENDSIPAEIKQDFELALSSTGHTVLNKLDSTIQFIRAVESNIDLKRAHAQALLNVIKAEQERLNELADRDEKSLNRFKAYLIRLIHVFAPTPKKGAKKLIGRVGELSIQKGSASVEVLDEELIPDEYKTVNLKIPMTTWKYLVRMQPSLDESVEFKFVSVSKTAIKEALKDDSMKIPGAKITIGEEKLKVK